MKKNKMTNEKINELQNLDSEIKNRLNKNTNFISIYWNHYKLEKCLEAWKLTTGCKYPNIIIDDTIIIGLDALVKNLRREEKANMRKEDRERKKREENAPKPYKRQSLEDILKREEENSRLIRSVLNDDTCTTDIPDSYRKRRKV